LSEEQIRFEPAALHLIARAAAGSMRDALSLTDQAIAYGNQTVNEAEVRNMLGAIDQSYLHQLLRALLDQNSAELMEQAKQMDARSISFEAALNDFAGLLHQIAMVQTNPDTLASDLPERATLLALAEQITPEQLQLFYQIAILGRRDIGLAPDEYAGFTMTLLRMLAFCPVERLNTPSPDITGTPNTKTGLAARSLAAQQTTTTPPTRPEYPEQAQQRTLVPELNAETTPKTIEEMPHSQPAQSVFDGDWRGLVENHLKLGLARALAQNCEMVAYDADSITLRVAESQKHLVSPNYQEKLTSAIHAQFGKKIKLHFEVGQAANTPAKQHAIEKATVQSNAEQAIMQDGFVQSLIQEFGATIIPNSIKPVQ
jgi:DNA polymerase III subunit gamma/tau